MVILHSSIPVCDSVYTFPETAEFVVSEFILLYIHQTYPHIKEIYNLSIAYHFGYNSVSFTFDTQKSSATEAVKSIITIPVFTKQKNVIKYESCITKPYPVYAEIGKHGYSDVEFNATSTTTTVDQTNAKRRKTTK